MEAALSYPIPIVDAGVVSLAAFYYGVKRARNETSITKPLARLLATYPDGPVLSFRKQRDQELFPGLVPPTESGQLFSEPATPRERMNNRRLLFELYPDVILIYKQNQEASSHALPFLRLFGKAAELPLLPYYHALNPDFFNWLENRK